jgi:nucleoside-diphosphate-sugar epimerase
VSQARRVLITGASGFIGRWSIAPLLRAGFEIHAVVSGARRVPLELAGATLHQADLLETNAIDQLVERCAATHLLHFAWIATPGVYWQSGDNFRWLTASQYLLKRFHAAGGRRVLMAGSCAEYDWSKAGVCDELASPLADRAAVTPTPYAACKIALQKHLADFSRDAALSSAWGRIFFQFGPYEHPDRLVPSVIRNLLMAREAPCTQGLQVRSFLHASDVGAAFAHVLLSALEGPVNIGSGQAISVADLASDIAGKMGRPDLLRLGVRPPAAAEPPLLLPNLHRLHDESGWRPRFTLSQGLDDTIAWWRQQESP